MSSRQEVSLDLVQRIIISVLVIVVVGSISAVLGAYIAFNQDTMSRVDAVGLWVMTGVIGLVTAVAVLVINRRRPYSPLVLLGLVPMAITGWSIFRSAAAAPTPGLAPTLSTAHDSEYGPRR